MEHYCSKSKLIEEKDQELTHVKFSISIRHPSGDMVIQLDVGMYLVFENYTLPSPWVAKASDMVSTVRSAPLYIFPDLLPDLSGPSTFYLLTFHLSSLASCFSILHTQELQGQAPCFSRAMLDKTSLKRFAASLGST